MIANKVFQAIAALGVAVLSPTSANAEAILCLGNVNAVALHANGAVLVAYGTFSLHTICNVNSASGGIDRDTCKAWLAVIQTARAQERPIRIYYDSIVAGNPASCAAITYGQNTSPYFLEAL